MPCPGNWSEGDRPWVPPNRLLPERVTRDAPRVERNTKLYLARDQPKEG